MYCNTNINEHNDAPNTCNIAVSEPKCSHRSAEWWFCARVHYPSACGNSPHHSAAYGGGGYCARW